MQAKQVPVILQFLSESSKGHYETVQLLLRAGADVNIQDYTGRGALGWARGGRDRRIEQALEQAGARD